ncbi:Protein of unknown function DUF1064 [uncultured Caudovirales phage]|uniref:DUF1064 domain-containing protein n=1 Tax=uncultured Caudovirales phage TaxID=2100421 RepID=A0A6J7WTS5_9CAUD|nr:Protein of unknown function DUF1064 [uncultured Caudovirales phage]
MKLGQARPKNKFGAKRTEFDGVSFASKAEAKRYAELSILQRAGQIENLKCQPKFPLTVEGVLVGSYIADFSYFLKGSTDLIVEDVKSPATKTALYRLKAKLVKAIHGITIVEVMNG